MKNIILYVDIVLFIITLILLSYRLILFLFKKKDKSGTNLEHNKESNINGLKKSKVCVNCNVQEGVLTKFSYLEKNNELTNKQVYVCNECTDKSYIEEIWKIYLLLLILGILNFVGFVIHPTVFIIISFVTIFMIAIIIDRYRAEFKYDNERIPIASRYLKKIEKEKIEKEKMEKEEMEKAVHNCSRCQDGFGSIASFWYGKKIILSESKSYSGNEVTTTTSYEVRDIHHNCEYILCNKCVKKYLAYKAKKLFINGIVVSVISAVLIITDKELDKQAVFGILGIAPAFGLLLWGILTLNSSPKHEETRSQAVIHFFSLKFEKAGYNQFYTPWEYKVFCTKASSLNSIVQSSPKEIHSLQPIQDNSIGDLNIKMENYCPFCQNYDKNSGACSEIHENVRSYPKKFINKCNGKFFKKI